jgi:hypothetical protein
MIKNTIINRGVLKKIALALEELNNDVIYVGGAVVSLYINDPAADDVRPTKDVDISVSLATLVELEALRENLVKKKFIQMPEEVICRFRYEDITVDVMNTKEIGWAPANPWFAPGYLMKQKLKVENQDINILPIAYFLASKFTAYNGRGKSEPRTSHDFEDIIYILDNCTDIVNQLNNMPGDVGPFIKNEFQLILNDKVKQEAIEGNLFFEGRNARLKRMLDNLNTIVKNV